MGVRLTVKMRGEEGGADKAQVVVLDDDLITMGRDQTCQVVLAQQAVSRSHARISRDGSLFFVEDLGSSYGTLINGTKLPRGEKRLLRNGDTIAIAQFDVVFDRVADAADDGKGDTNFLSRKVVKEVMKGLTTNREQPYFRVMNGPREGKRIVIHEAQEYVFGRDEAANIVLKDDLVSRRHAKVRRDLSGTHVEDLGSRNGIKVNGKKTRRASLRDRDEVEIGGVRLLFIDPIEVREAPLVMPSLHDGDDEEGTQALPKEPEAVDEPPSMAEVPPPEEEAPPPEEGAPPPEEGAPSPSQTHAEELEQPPQEEPPPEYAAEEPPPEDGLPPEGEGYEGAEGEGEASQARGLDLSNRQTQIMLGVVGVMVLVGLVLLILLIAGA